MQDDFFEPYVGLFSYEAEEGVLRWRERPNGRVPAGSTAGARTASGHVRIKIRGRMLMAHRMVWRICTGAWPSGQIDHINGDPADNRFANLRLTDASGNAQNRRKAARSRKTGTLIGAYWIPKRGKWKAALSVNYKMVTVGWFDTEQEAHAAYLGAKRLLHKTCSI